MKSIKQLLVLFVVLSGLASPVVQAGKGGNANKVAICHNTSSESNPYILLTVPGNAAAAHELHGDFAPDSFGSCEEEEPLPEEGLCEILAVIYPDLGIYWDENLGVCVNVPAD